MSDSFIHMRIDKDLKLELQIIALKQNTTVTSIITELIEVYHYIFIIFLLFCVRAFEE